MFAQELKKALGRPPGRALAEGECQNAAGQRCTICHAVAVDYETEVAAKNRALQTSLSGLPLEPLVPSPRGRGYRTTTKRRITHGRLGLVGEHGKPFPVLQCAVEPPSHALIYAAIERSLARARAVAEAANWAIVKGSYEELTVILNVTSLSGEVVRAANIVSKAVTKAVPAVVSFFLYEDTRPGKYYMGASKPRMHRVYGPDDIFLRLHGRRFLYSPMAFSQVNPGIAELMIDRAGELLGLPTEGRLLDLYCGYGLFALALADQAKTVVGIEMSPASVASAIDNAKRQRAGNVRFLTRDITADRLQGTVHDGDRVLLDPPRNGTAAGVVETVAAARPAAVAHIFCNIDILRDELRRWQQSGYQVRRVVPFDMFPGTDAVEIMVGLTV